MIKTTVNHQKGAIGGIPESVIAIAVGILLVAGAIALGNKAWDGAKVKREELNAQQLITNLRSLNADRPGGSFFGTTSYVTNLRARGTAGIPNGMDAGNNIALRSQWNSQVFVLSTQPDLAAVSYNDVRRADCIKLITAVPNEILGTDGCLQVGATAADATGALSNCTGTPVAVPVTPPNAVTACNRDQNQVSFVFSRN